MHMFAELVSRSTAMAMRHLRDIYSNSLNELNDLAGTHSVKNLQMVRLHMATTAVGIFAMFDSMLQKGLGCDNGFAEAERILAEEDKAELLRRFTVYKMAINVLKHGHGRSYETLLKYSDLPFRVKRPNEEFFDEGDVSELATLIEVNAAFVEECAKLVDDVSAVVRRSTPDFHF